MLDSTGCVLSLGLATQRMEFCKTSALSAELSSERGGKEGGGPSLMHVELLTEQLPLRSRLARITTAISISLLRYCCHPARMVMIPERNPIITPKMVESALRITFNTLICIVAVIINFTSFQFFAADCKAILARLRRTALPRLPEMHRMGI
jgi:hypothetical protein